MGRKYSTDTNDKFIKMNKLLILLVLALAETTNFAESLSGELVNPLTIGDELPDSTVHSDSCRFYLNVSDSYYPEEVDSLRVSILYTDLKSFPTFKFINLLLDSSGQTQVTHLPGKYFVKLSKKCSPDFKQDFSFSMEKTEHSRIITSNISQLDPSKIIIVSKPVIYCYPNKKIEVDIKLITDVHLTFTYPVLDEFWKTTLYPNGDIKVKDKMYPYLFWDGVMNINSFPTSNSGFIVSKKDAISFFEEKLFQLGLNQREISDFITYWCPKMTNESYKVNFLIGKDYDNYIGKLGYSILPDTEIRIFALIKEYDGSEITEPILPTIERKGFTVVEWGGSIIPKQITTI
jgi:hypothetical protein